MPDKKVRFDEFLLDFDRFQLFRHGHLVELEGLPLQLLMFLVDNKGKLVTREQVADHLWGKDVFVDVEQGINTAIRKVRRALEDDVAQPRYVQTVVGRGYRFVAPSTAGHVPLPESPSASSPYVSAEALGRAIMMAAGIDPDNPKTDPKPPKQS